MRKILLLLFSILIFALSACQESDEAEVKKEVSETEVKDFIMEYKMITHNVPVPEEAYEVNVLEKVKPYLNDDWYERNEKDKRVMFPRTYVSVSGLGMTLNDVTIDRLEDNPDGEGYAIAYTLNLTIGEEVVEKKGDMKIIKGEPNGFVITYDWEKEIIRNGVRFK